MPQIDSKRSISVGSEARQDRQAPSRLQQRAAPGLNVNAPVLREDFVNWPLSTATGWTNFLLPALPAKYTIAQEDAPGRAGRKCLAVSIQAGAYWSVADQINKKKRLEAACNPTTPIRGGLPGSTWWYKWSLHIPVGYAWVPVSNQYQIIGQIHDIGETYVPPIALHHQVSGSASSLRLEYGLQSIGDTRQEVIVGITRDVWADVKIQVLHSQGADGFCKWWVNGVLRATFTGRNLYNDDYNYFKVGMYRGPGDPIEQLQTDNFKLMDIAMADSEIGLGRPLA